MIYQQYLNQIDNKTFIEATLTAIKSFELEDPIRFWYLICNLSAFYCGCCLANNNLDELREDDLDRFCKRISELTLMEYNKKDLTNTQKVDYIQLCLKFVYQKSKSKFWDCIKNEFLENLVKLGGKYNKYDIYYVIFQANNLDLVFENHLNEILKKVSNPAWLL